MSLSIVIKFLMSTIYLGCGVFLLVGNNIFNFTDLQKYGLGFALIAYGSFRLFLSIKKFKEMQNEEE
jgi:hypothetical protein